MADGLSHNTVMGIAQDKYGFMWFSTYAGIDRFDGYEFVNYAAKDSLAGKLYFFTDLDADRKGNIWSTNINELIFRYNDHNDKLESFSTRNIGGDSSAEHFWFDKRNNLWLFLNPGIAYLKNQSDSACDLKKMDCTDSLFNSAMFFAIAEDSAGNVWLGCEFGLVRVGMKGDSINHVSMFRFSGEDFVSDNINAVSTIFIDDNNIVWAGTYSDGLKRINISDISGYENGVIPCRGFYSSEYKYGSMKNGIWSILPYDDNNLIIRTTQGIEIFNKKTLSGRSLCSLPLNPFATEEGEVYSAMYLSDDGVLWVGTNNGVYRILLRKDAFHTINKYIPQNSENQPYEASCVLADSRNRLWIGTPGKGLHLGIPDQGGNYIFKHFTREKTNNTNQIYYNRISCLAETSGKKIWVSAGFFQLAEGSHSDITFSAKRPIRFAQSYFISDVTVNQITENRGAIWIVYLVSGITIYDTLAWKGKPLLLTGGKQIKYFPYTVSLPDGRLFLRDNTCFYELSRDFLESDNSISPVRTDTILECEIDFPKGKFIVTRTRGGSYFWIPSVKNGLYRYYYPDNKDNNEKAKLIFSRNFRQKNGLSNDFIYDLIDDKNGNIWVSTQNGLNMINPETGLVKVFNVSDGLPDNCFTSGACSDNEGYLYFCNTRGVVRFHPDSLYLDTIHSPTYLTQINLFNRDITSFSDIDLAKPVSLLKSVDLKYNQNFISFTFASLNFMDNEKIRYRYRMEGVNDDWIVSGSRRYAEYQDLKPGNYVFRVNSTSNDGKWSHNEAKITIAIAPPFWLRAWFIIILLALSVLGMLSVIRLREKSLRKRTIWLEGRVKEETSRALRQRMELDQMKSRFYTNISHEFRTPITLINSSAREIEKNIGGNPATKFTSTIMKASGRLLDLVNQLLDLSKIEAGKLELKASEGDITSTIRLVWQIYLSDAERRGIRYTFTTEPAEIICWYDHEFITKIMHNLISNALKFTPEGREINVSVKLCVQGSDKKAGISDVSLPFVIIKVSDTGKGISEKHLGKIFDRFYQVDNSNTREYEGTGIGLSIVEELIKRHYGQINVMSNPGYGSVFTLYIPVGKHRFKEEEISELSEEESPVTDEFMISQEESGRSKPGMFDIDKPLILLAEDNNELRTFLKDGLLAKYRIMEAVNGKEAAEKIAELNPDIIVSDVMMPEMDGMELCAIIKNQISTCHIPVILLTAKADIESKLEGLKTGADDYLTKPFNEEELIVRIDNLLKQRQLMREKFRCSPLSDITLLQQGRTDQDFLNALLDAIKRNLSNDAFTIEELAVELNLGKRTLLRKIKALTGLNPVELMRVIRIKNAAALMLDSNFNISEAAFATGFSSLSYFSKAFREVMGMNPSDYFNKK